MVSKICMNSTRYSIAYLWHELTNGISEIDLA